jgi:NADH:ubiquinone oxidoreductase subunit 4 (subunit M)
VVSIAFLGFMVKLPVYGLHFWLPIAHVEAPTYGSIILAGLLLKIGGCGLYRVSFFTSFVSFSPYFISYLTFSLVFSSIVCCVQADFKRLVAYSSIAHIIVVTLAVVLSSSLGINSFLLIMVTHGISSPILFILVGITYRLHGTRILAIYRGLLSRIPLLSAFMVFCFTVSVPLPPSLAFLGELQFATVFLSVCFYSILAIFTFVFLGALYNLLWLGSLFGPSNFQISSNLEFSLSTRESLTLGFISLQSLFVLLIL